MTLPALLVAGALAVMPLPGQANAPHVAPWVPEARTAGSARLSFFGLAVYDATLWIGSGFRAARFAEHAFALELSYLRDLRGADIARRSIQEMQRAQPLSETQAQQWEEALRRLLPDVRRGDRLTGIHRPGQGVVFLANGAPAGEIADAEFARRFFGIWLSPTTSEPRLRQSLLSGATP